MTNVLEDLFSVDAVVEREEKQTVFGEVQKVRAAGMGHVFGFLSSELADVSGGNCVLLKAAHLQMVV